jgi:tetratricopeptide (TPR) repeat protein
MGYGQGFLEMRLCKAMRRKLERERIAHVSDGCDNQDAAKVMRVGVHGLRSMIPNSYHLVLFILLLALVLGGGCASKQADSSPQGDRGWSEFVRQGVADISKGNYQRALRVMDVALERQPENPGLYYNRGLCYARLKQYAKAVDDFGRAIRLDPQFVEAYNNLAWTHFSMGGKDRAVRVLRRALRKVGDSAQIQYNLGLIHAEKGDHHKAAEHYSRAIELRPAMAEAYNNRGVARVHLRQYHKAMEDLGRALSLDPDNARYAYNQGVAFEEQGRTEKAISLYTKALQKDPSFAPAHNNRGLLRFQLGEKALGCRDLKQACDGGLCDRYRQLRQSGECGVGLDR